MTSRTNTRQTPLNQNSPIAHDVPVVHLKHTLIALAAFALSTPHSLHMHCYWILHCLQEHILILVVKHINLHWGMRGHDWRRNRTVHAHGGCAADNPGSRAPSIG